MRFNVNIEDIKNIVKNRNIKEIYIFGNAPNLNDVSLKFIKGIQRNVLTIGLNRTFLKFIPDIIMYHHKDIYELMVKTKIKPKYIYHFIHRETSISTDKWIKYKSFKYLPKDKLFGYRNILIVALHLCHVLNIKDITLFGVDLVHRNYFFDHKIHTSDKINTLPQNNIVPYDHKLDGSKRFLVQDLVREVLESLINEEFKISFQGNSSFLKSIKGLHNYKF